MRRAPVRDDEALEVPVFFQNIGEQISVFAGIVAPDAVVRAHHGRNIGVVNADFKGQQVAFASSAFVDRDIDGVAPAFLIVERIVLDVAEDVLRLQAFHNLADHLAGEYGIFAEIFKGAAVARLARQIDAAPECHVVALRAEFTSDERAVFVGGIEIPAGGAGNVSGQRGGVAAIFAAHANAIGGV